MGSWGSQIAGEAARRLGYRMVWREVINQAALRAGVPEVALATIDELGFLGIKPTHNQMNAYHGAVRQIMNEMSQEGNVVIVGRAGQVILQDHPGTIHVRIIAPRSVRIERVSAEKNIPGLTDGGDGGVGTAAALLDQSDHARSEYLRHYYHVDVNDPELYDLVINTEHIDIPASAALLVSLVQACQSITVH